MDRTLMLCFSLSSSTFFCRHFCVVHSDAAEDCGQASCEERGDRPGHDALAVVAVEVLAGNEVLVVAVEVVLAGSKVVAECHLLRLLLPLPLLQLRRGPQ